MITTRGHVPHSIQERATEMLDRPARKINVKGGFVWCISMGLRWRLWRWPDEDTWTLGPHKEYDKVISSGGSKR